MELSSSFMASKIFLWRLKMLTCLMPRLTVKSKLIVVVSLLFLNLVSTPCSNFSHEWCLVGHFGVIKYNHSFIILGAIYLVFAEVFIVLFLIFVRRCFAFSLLCKKLSVSFGLSNVSVMVISIIVRLVVDAFIV